jgi:hypothetical protein
MNLVNNLMVAIVSMYGLIWNFQQKNGSRTPSSLLMPALLTGLPDTVTA